MGCDVCTANTAHLKYLTQFAADVYANMKKSIREANLEYRNYQYPLEIKIPAFSRSTTCHDHDGTNLFGKIPERSRLGHLYRNYIDKFRSREDILEQIQQRLIDPKLAEPLVLFGPSRSGKFALTAKLVKLYPS